MNNAAEAVALFAELFVDEIRRARLPLRELHGGECTAPGGRRCGICHAGRLPYPAEAELRQRALDRFRTIHRISCPFDPLVRSESGRFYRSVTKRKVFHSGRRSLLGLIENPADEGARPFPVAVCAIEHRDHAPIYAAIQRWIDTPEFAPLGEVLRYVILKSGHRDHALILNLTEPSAAVMSLASALSRRISKSFPAVGSIFVSPSHQGKDRYYLDDGGSGTHTGIRKLYGRAQLSQRIGDRTFHFPPLVFTQVNPATTARMEHLARELLSGAASGTLYDLYCGYGLFSLQLADGFDRVVGVEASGTAIAAAKDNATRLHVPNALFLRREITAESVLRLIRRDRSGIAVLLDPPRGGTLPGVVEAIASFKPERVLHMWCNIDLMPAALETWEHCGYRAARVIPVDHFPGTADLEVMSCLVPIGKP